MADIEYRRLRGESDDALIYRVCEDKDLIGSWGDVADILNSLTGHDYDESKYRKQYQSFKRMFEANAAKFGDAGVQIEELKKARMELAKERVSIREERVALNRSIRDIARNNNTIEQMKMAILDSASPYEKYEREHPCVHGDSTMIVHLTDMHIGADISSTFNTYNTEVAGKCLNQYLDRIFEEQERYNCKDCVLVLGGDLVSGLIHFSIRCEARENIIQQVITASDLITGFTLELGKRFDSVDVYAVNGNHGRAVAQKELSLKGENFDALIPYYVLARTENQKNIYVHTEDYDNNEESIARFYAWGYSYYVVHGDKDTPQDVVQSITTMFYEVPDVVLMGHRHSNAVSSVYGTKVIQSGSFMGMDNFSLDHRLTSVPEQWLIIADQQNPVKALIPVTFDHTKSQPINIVSIKERIKS